ncbi:MAG: asparagine synthase (glutamine-hydrolyzing) [Pseudomonadales bacterium]
MCGIAGIAGSLTPDTAGRVQAMLRALEHRGPDQHGLWCSGASGHGAVLGHRRLSILDLSEAGRQPMIHAGSGVALSYNGECYNFAELRRELESLGHQFRSQSDTEVLLAAYVEWGEQAIERLRGMFAIALWDPRERSLLMVRDRLGIKPLYYACTAGQVVFASEVRAILQANPALRRLDRVALSAYLWHGFVPGPRTLVADIQLVPAGTMLRVRDDGRIEAPRRYWRLPRPSPSADAESARLAAAEELEHAVRLRLVSDVPLGVFLSGGVDSSVIATLAQRNSAKPIQTFNITFDDAKFDESSYAERVARALGTEHHRIPLTEANFREQLPAALDSLDQPTFDAVNTYFVSRAVREAGLTVALSGAGGDELFGGYASFRELPAMQTWSRLARPLPARLRNLLAGAVARLAAGAGSEVPPQTRWGKLADILAADGDPVALYQCAYALFTRRMHADLQLRADEPLMWGLYPERYQEFASEVAGMDPLFTVSHLELQSFIGERLLRDTDTASMAVSLEARVPILDHKFIEAVSRLPAESRYLPLGRKGFLRALMADHVPADIFDRPKAGFELPLELWCKRSLLADMDATFRDLNLAHAIGLDAEVTARIWRAFRKGGAGLYWSRVWALFVLMRWCQRYGVYV